MGRELLELRFEDIIGWMLALANQYGYLGIFVMSLVGALSVFFPVPYTVAIFTLAGLKVGGAWVFEPIWIAVAAGIGSAIGELSGYLIGVGGRKAIREKYKAKMDLLAKVFHKYGLVVIFLFALTPLPDDLLFIPLGVMRYDIVRAFVPALIGKFCMNLIVAYSGRFSIGIIRDIFGVESDWISAVIGMVLALVLLGLVFLITFKTDWEKFLARQTDV
jgi:membrane protein YqaA with SNARE-associated domain